MAGQALELKVELRRTNPTAPSVSRTHLSPTVERGDPRAYSEWTTGRKLVSPGKKPGSPSEERGFQWSRWRVAGTVLAGAGLAAGVTGFVLVNNATKRCDEVKRQELACVNLGRDQLPGHVLMAVGGAAVIGGISLWIFYPNVDVAAGPSSLAIFVGGTL